MGRAEISLSVRHRGSGPGNQHCRLSPVSGVVWVEDCRQSPPCSTPPGIRPPAQGLHFPMRRDPLGLDSLYSPCSLRQLPNQWGPMTAGSPGVGHGEEMYFLAEVTAVRVGVSTPPSQPPVPCGLLRLNGMKSNALSTTVSASPRSYASTALWGR